MKFFCSFSIAFLLIFNGLAQTTVYVSPTGTGNGTSEATPQNFNTAISNFNIGPGHTIILLDGIYEFTNDLYLWNKTGTAAAPITIKAKNKHMAIIKGNGAYWPTGMLYCILQEASMWWLMVSL